MREFAKAEAASKKFDTKLGKLGETGKASGKEISDAMVKAGKRAGSGIDKLIRRLHSAGGEHKKLASTMRQQMSHRSVRQ